MNSHARDVEIALRQMESLFKRGKELGARPPKAKAHHRVYFSFARQANGWWYCRFHQNNFARTPLSRRITFCAVEKVYETVHRAGLADPESRQALDEAVARGQGQILLILNDNQFHAVTRKS